MWTENEIKGKILHKLTRLGKFRHSHTSIDNLPKGFPKEIRGQVKTCVEMLRKELILLSKPTSYGLEISVNQDKLEEIMSYIDCFLSRQ